jgi:TIR domain-containing protein/NB-ARC domain-containing protein
VVWESSIVVDRDYEWDFFISYTQADRAWAEWTAWLLEEDHHRVLIQAWDFAGGSNWVQRMRDGVSKAERTLAVLSPDYLESEFGTAEWTAAWSKDPLSAQKKLLTVRVRKCDRPDFLSQIVSVDLFGTTEAEAQIRLRWLVAGAVTGRVNEETAPLFSGGGRAIVRRPLFPDALPGVWRVLGRNPNFTGRVDDLAALTDALADATTVTVQAVHGMGGVGKTQLATQFAYEHAADYDLVYWLAAGEPATLSDQFTALAALLGLDPLSDPEGLQAQIHRQLRSVPGWLLIFDNADRRQDIQPWIPAIPMLSGTRGHVIITTRRRNFGDLDAVLDLDVVSPGEALALLRTRVPGLPDDTGLELAERLGFLPLALDQAAAYMNRTMKSAEDYLRLLRDRAAELYRQGRTSGRNVTMTALWDISLEAVTHQDQAAAQLLDLCAYLAPERIPPDLFTRHPVLLPEPLAAAAGDELAFDEAIAVLADYSLLKRTEFGLQIHRVLQDALRARHQHESPVTAAGATP